jgi:ATP-binding cassette subfamily B (MDR/TAP) protein 1
MSLLLRFYDPSSGEILLDGVDIKTLNVRWLRSQIGYVGQEPVLFQGSVSDNVSKGRATYGDTRLLSLEEVMKESDASAASSCCSTLVPPSTKKEAYKSVPPSDLEAPTSTASASSALPPADILDACVASNAHDFISTFSSGYDTDVGEGSIMVSGGQKQRIAIARAIVKKPSVLLLDEATSALDAASEKAVQQSIDALQQSHSQTTIVIAHRLSTIKNADKIVVINKGEVVEEGTHDELLVLDGLYAQLWAKQRGLNNSSSSKGSLNNLAALAAEK